MLSYAAAHIWNSEKAFQRAPTVPSRLALVRKSILCLCSTFSGLLQSIYILTDSSLKYIEWYRLYIPCRWWLRNSTESNNSDVEVSRWRTYIIVDQIITHFPSRILWEKALWWRMRDVVTNPALSHFLASKSYRMCLSLFPLCRRSNLFNCHTV